MSILVALMAFAPCGAAKEPMDASALVSLVNAERGFASMAAERGTQEAFLANLADDAVVFRPGPVAAKPWVEAHPFAAGALLSWGPIEAEIAGSGDLGYTTGPWEYRPKGASDDPVAFGFYVTLWKKQADGAWKAVLDTGTSTEKPDKPFDPWKAPMHLRTPVKPMSADEARKGIEAADREFARLYAAKGPAKALDAFLADDGRYHRDGSFPRVSKKSILAGVQPDGFPLAWRTEKVDVASSGDFGYSYGYVDATRNGETGTYAMYVKIWRREQNGAWRIVLDILNEFPPAKS